jgi:hypothetical protein
MKSHLRDLTKLIQVIYQDACIKCAAPPQDRDISTILSRVEKEGLSFLTITLPGLGQDFELCLDQGFISPDLFRSFKKRLKTPAFLQGFFGLIFDTGTGRILDEPSVCAIEGIWQIAYSLKKLHLACTPKRVQAALQGFVACEHYLQVPLHQDDIDYFSQVSRHVWSPLLSNSEFSDLDKMVPKHGPGATAEKVSGNQKFRFSRWHERLEPYFPMFHWAFSSENAYDSQEFQFVDLISEEQEQPVRVTAVPKTLKTPRIIAIEPVCMQYVQQALSRSLTKGIEKYSLTAGHINFSDQTVNQRLALMSSWDKSLATLDLSSASDRVPSSLVSIMLDCNPLFRDAVFACRSRRAQVKCDQVIDLAKFASMGSALCFPIESMYFYTICIAALLRKRNLPVTSRSINIVSRDVYVYGDDIIVPVDSAAAVCDYLQKYYCKVNVHKSFWNGNFRESCGTDAYNGEVVTPTYVRELPPTDRRKAKNIISWVETSNLFYRKGYWLTSNYMIKHVERLLGALPLIEETCSGLGKITFQNLSIIPQRTKYNRRYQVKEVLTWIPSSVRRADKLAGYNALLKSLILLELSNQTITEKEHLERSVRYGTVTLKRRWTKPY